MAIKKTANSAKTASSSKPKRLLDKPRYKTLRLHKRIRHPQQIVGAFRLFWQSMVHLVRHWKQFLFITTVYFLLSLVLVTGMSFLGTSDVTATKEGLQEVLTGFQGQITTGFALFSLVVSGGTSATSEAGGVYQTLLMIFMSLVIIWALRQTYANEKITTKQAFYKSSYPLVPFILVLIVVGLQLLPLLAGASVYGQVIGSGLAVTELEKVLWFVLFLCASLLTVYMVSSSIFALYIVTLPNMTPMKALRSARELVRYRRWTIMRKVIFLPIVMLILSAVVMIPILLYATVLSQWVFLFLSLFGVVIVHAYMYRLYREML